jgi:hypothetical protein
MAFGAGLTRGARLLTHRSIETLRPAEAPYRVPDQRCMGLAVRVAPSGVKTWDLAYRIRGTGKMRRLSLGRTTDVSLEQARERANELTSAARGGRDLIGEEGEARDAAASRITVGSLNRAREVGKRGRIQTSSWQVRQRLLNYPRLAEELFGGLLFCSPIATPPHNEALGLNRVENRVALAARMAFDRDLAIAIVLDAARRRLVVVRGTAEVVPTGRGGSAGSAQGKGDLFRS